LPLSVELRGPRQHSLQDAIPQKKKMEKRSAGVETDQYKQGDGAELVSFDEHMADCVIRHKERRHFPDQQFKRYPAE
jgi:hypothetical protein